MKKILIGIAILLIASTVIFAQSNKTGTTKKSATAVIYTCPMHKEIRRNKPGKCPKCGMKLVAIKKQNPKKNRRSRRS